MNESMKEMMGSMMPTDAATEKMMLKKNEDEQNDLGIEAILLPLGVFLLPLGCFYVAKDSGIVTI